MSSKGSTLPIPQVLVPVPAPWEQLRLPPCRFGLEAHFINVAVSWAQAQLVASDAAGNTMDTCISKSSDTMYGDLIMDEGLVCGLPTSLLSSSVTGDEAVFLTQVHQVASKAVLNAMAICVSNSGDTMPGDGARLTNDISPSSYTVYEAVSWNQVQESIFEAASDAVATCIIKSGGMMPGILDVSQNFITGVANPSKPQGELTKICRHGTHF